MLIDTGLKGCVRVEKVGVSKDGKGFKRGNILVVGFSFPFYTYRPVEDGAEVVVKLRLVLVWGSKGPAIEARVEI